MQIVFRTDASTAIGSGHVVRCATLAQALKMVGAQILFVCRAELANMTDWLSDKGFSVAVLVGLDGPPAEQDAEATKEAMRRHGFDNADWVVADHYGIGVAWETHLRLDGHRLLVIDDLANRMHDCDLLLDQNLVASYRDRYDGLIPTTAVGLFGPRYAMLQQPYADAAASNMVQRKGPPRRLLIYFGAADLPGLTLHTLRLVLQHPQASHIDVVIGAGNAHRREIEDLGRSDPRISIHLNQPSLVGLMQGADLAFGAGGATSWERLCVGLPAFVLTLADNQRPIAAELHRLGLAYWAGDADGLDESDFAHSLGEIMDRDLHSWFNAAHSRRVDGRGVHRVAAAMLGNSLGPLTCRAATAADEWLLLDWANDATTRATAFDPRPIAPETHHQWLNKRLGDPTRFRLFVVQGASGVDVGQVRFEREPGGDWVISYSLARELRGRGLGDQLLGKALESLRDDVGSGLVSGLVRADNLASRRVFDRLQFTCSERADNVMEYRRTL